MKASDICVGDWLNIYTFPNDNPKQDDLFPAKMSAVSVFDPFKDPDDVTVELVIPNTDGIASRPLNTCLPIKLTEEILVKNGFEKTTDDWNRHIPLIIFESVGFPTISIHADMDMKHFWVHGTIDLTYVHQLQHLLRLCGIEKEIELCTN